MGTVGHMNEPETNPQRQPVSPDAEPSHPTTELPPVPREQSDSSATETIPVVNPATEEVLAEVAEEQEPTVDPETGGGQIEDPFHDVDGGGPGHAPVRAGRGGIGGQRGHVGIAHAQVQLAGIGFSLSRRVHVGLGYNLEQWRTGAVKVY